MTGEDLGRWERFVRGQSRAWDRRGRPVTDVASLARLADEGKSVVIGGWAQHTPAKWLANMPFAVVVKMMASGQIYEYAGDRPQSSSQQSRS